MKRSNYLRHSGRNGFALLVTIVLVAFLVLILVGLATFTRVETQVAGNAQNLAKARQNALFALNVAVGRLQTTVAYDRQVTAAGDKVAAAQATNPFWTAAWDTTGALGAPVWLVSGVGAAPGTDYSAASANNVRLVSTATVGTPTGVADKRHVYVLKEDVLSDQVPGIPSPPSIAIGKFAYWVGDEGVKGNIGIEDKTRSTASSVVPFDAGQVVANTRQVERLARLAAARGGPDALSGLGLNNETADAARWAGVAKIIDRTQPRFSYADTTARSDYLRDSFHSLTVDSRGLLTNGVSGGLRRNITFDPAPAFNFIRDLNTQAPDITAIATPFLATSAPTSAATDPISAPRPMITEIALDVVPFRQDSPGGIASAPLRIGYRLRMEFWNPYPFPMRHAAAVGADDYRVRVSGLPTLTLSTPLQPTPPSPNTYNLATLITPTTDIVVEHAADLPAGGFIRRSQNPVFLGNATTAVTTVSISDATVPSTGPTLADDRLNYSWPAGALRFEIYKNDGSANPIQIIKDVPYTAGSRTNSAGSTPWYIASNNAFPGTSFTSTTELATKGITFHAAVDETLIPDIASWVNPTPAPGTYPADYRAATVSWGDGYFDSASGTPADNASTPLLIFPGTGFFQFNSNATLTDLSAQSQLSLGQLQFAGCPAARPFAIGNPWGGALNGIFDSSFLLPVPNPGGALAAANPWPSGRLLPNPRYRVWGSPTLGDLQSVESAKNILVEGAFNVNSTLATAWEAILGRSTLFSAASSPNTLDLNNDGVAGEIYPAELANPALFFPNSTDLISDLQVGARVNRGHRALTDGQVQDLANRIATAVRARANPFMSVQEFINSGVVQQAIADNMDPLALPAALPATRVNTVATAYRSDYLTQAVLLNPLMPFLTVRSDTFVIRSYGEVLNPATASTEGVAYCEAVLQRVPEKVDGTNVMTDTPAGNFGRKFQVVRFRWLTNDDL